MSPPGQFASDSGGSPDGAPSLRQRLKRETAAAHRRLESQLRLLGPELSMDRYRRVLQIFYGFYAPVEAGLVRLVPAGPPLGFPFRARAELLEQDLLALGLSRQALAGLPRCADLPPLRSREDLAGCLYVIEGACLGGQMIAPVLHRCLGVDRGTGASFFVGDAEQTAARWRLVLAWLEGVERTGARTEAIVAAARASFLTLGRWVEAQEAPWSGDGEHRGEPERL